MSAGEVFALGFLATAFLLWVTRGDPNATVATVVRVPAKTANPAAARDQRSGRAVQGFDGDEAA